MTTQIPPEPPQAAFFALDWSQPLFPAIEANQGLISLGALGVALWFAVLEYRRANRASEDRREEFRSAVIKLCEDLEAAIGHDFAAIARRFPATLDVLLRAPPPAPALIRATLDLQVQGRYWEQYPFLVERADGDREEARKELAKWIKTIREA